MLTTFNKFLYLNLSVTQHSVLMINFLNKECILNNIIKLSKRFTFHIFTFLLHNLILFLLNFNFRISLTQM